MRHARRRGRIDVDGRRADWVRDGALDGRPLLLLAHGAGAGAESAPLDRAARALVTRGLAVARFQFPYMQAALESGRRRPPDPARVLLAAWRAMLASARRWRGRAGLVIGGRSLGGRMASMLLAEEGTADAFADVAGAVYLGYPLSPAGKPHVERSGHLAAVPVPQLFVSGDRDVLADLAALRRVVRRLRRPPARLHVVRGGDHGLELRGARAEARREAWLDAVAAFVHEVAGC